MTADRPLDGQAAVITGSARRNGRAMALALAADGAAVVVNARTARAEIEQVAREIEAAGGRALAHQADITDEAQATGLVQAAVSRFGRIDILINNVGVGNYKNLVDTSLDDYVEMMDTNVRTTFLFSRHTVPVMIKQGEGLVLIISSMAGVYGFPGEAVYCATKFAQVGLAQGLDKELRPHGIKVGTICPGGTKTEFALGKGRTEASVEESHMLESEDVAAAILFACTQPKHSRIIQVQMRTMAEGLA